MVRTMLCLCSGHSGESEAFLGASQWRVIRIDNNPALGSLPHTQTLDVLDWCDWIDTIPHPELIWASPPCQQFSFANRNRDPEEWDLSILHAVMDIIDYLKPKWWIVENVRGAYVPFSKLLGPVTQRLGPFYLWGKFPHIACHVDWRGQLKQRLGHMILDVPEGVGYWLFNGVRYEKWESPQNAKIPVEISEELFHAVHNHRGLEEWCKNE